jgi:hypothetical protein
MSALGPMAATVAAAAFLLGTATLAAAEGPSYPPTLGGTTVNQTHLQPARQEASVLPFTGQEVAGLLAVGGLAIATGAAAVTFARRRPASR